MVVVRNGSLTLHVLCYSSIIPDQTLASGNGDDVRRLIAMLAALLAGSACAETNVSDLLAVLDSELQEKRPEVVTSLRPPLTAQNIADLEQEHRVVLPETVKALYMWHDGQDPGGFVTLVNNMQFLPLADMLATKAELDGMIGYDFELENWWHPAWLPIFQNGGGDYLVVDTAGIHTGNSGQLLNFYHDWEYRPIVANDLTVFVQGVIDYYAGTPVDEMDEFHSIAKFLPSLNISFDAAGTAEPLQ